MTSTSLSVVIPAAGSSQRLGQPKQLVTYKGQALIQNAVNLAFSVDPVEIIVVTGANAGAVKAVVQHPPVRWIHNPHWSTGMGGSIALGTAAINPDSTGLLILLCDQWRLQTQDLQNLATTWQSNPQRIVVAEADGTYMPPVIFPAACFGALQNLSGDQGARKVLGSHAELITPVPMEHAALDLNTQSHLEMLETSQGT